MQWIVIAARQSRAVMAQDPRKSSCSSSDRGKVMRVAIKAVLVTFCLLTAASAGATTEQPENWESAYSRHDYATALRLLRPLAAQGDAHAQYSLGVMLRDGQGVPQDPAGAAMWFR